MTNPSSHVGSTDDGGAPVGVPAPGLPEQCAYDLAVVGGGAAGLAAAVQGAADGLRTVLVTRGSPGGMLKSAARIEPVLGFPVGLGGSEFVARAVGRAQRFGAEVLPDLAAVRLRAGGSCHTLVLENGARLRARTLVLACGADGPLPDAAGLRDFLGAGVYLALPAAEVPALRGRDVFLMGEPTAMGEAALRLSRCCRSVVLLTREPRLSDRIPGALLERLRLAGNVSVRPDTEIVAAAGVALLETLLLRDRKRDRIVARDAAALFLLFAGTPNTAWLGGDLARDVHGAVLTGPDLRSVGPLADWPLAREPLPLETGRPGVFAAGALRGGAARDLAATVNEGIAAARQAWRYLRSSRDAVPDPGPGTGATREVVSTEGRLV